MANNGKWQLVFWLVTGLFIMVSVFIGNSVIANDKLSRDRDDKIMNIVTTQYQDVIQRLSWIEAKIK